MEGRRNCLYQEENIDESTNQIISDSSLVITPSQDVYYTFNQYIKTCIEYFKNLDRNDILQEDYLEMMDSVKELSSCPNIESQDEANKLMMRSIKYNTSTMDKYVKRVITNKIDPPPIPKQKNINLKDPELKIKGILKKKNITNKYDETNNSKKETKEDCNKKEK